MNSCMSGVRLSQDLRGLRLFSISSTLKCLNGVMRSDCEGQEFFKKHSREQLARICWNGLRRSTWSSPHGFGHSWLWADIWKRRSWQAHTVEDVFLYGMQWRSSRRRSCQQDLNRRVSSVRVFCAPPWTQRERAPTNYKLHAVESPGAQKILILPSAKSLCNVGKDTILFMVDCPCLVGQDRLSLLLKFPVPC
jgi:hypothetical protein